MYKTPEAGPEKDVTEEQAARLLAFSYTIEKITRRSVAVAIAMTVARQTVLHGCCSISHKEFGRRSGACRRTVDAAIKQLKQHSLIARTGTSESGAAIYSANLVVEHAPDAVV